MMFLWIEDLGSDDLWAHRNDPWGSRRELYRKALVEVGKLHRLDSASFELQPPFDEELYLWEQDYFANEFLAPASRTPKPRWLTAFSMGGELSGLLTELAALPRRLVHRDFQSENIMIRDGEVYFIDYQGLRLGRPEYDVASLVFDPYVPMPPAERDELLRIYFDLSEQTGQLRSVADDALPLCCATADAGDGRLRIPRNR